MSFVPASSIAPATVTVAGTVAVSNFPASQAVTGPLTDAQLRATAVPVSGSVSVANFPATQPISGSVSVSNLPATQPVSGSVSVSNFPATQPVSGTVAVSAVGGTVTVDGSAHPQPVTGPLTNAELRAADVTVDQGAGGVAWAVVQATVPWVVDASGATVPVSVQGQPILVDGSAHTQPISAASLPLPAGAATEDMLERVNGAVQESALTSLLEREKIPS